jgi:hypothetical protein
MDWDGAQTLLGCNNELATHGTHVWATAAQGSLFLSARRRRRKN